MSGLGLSGEFGLSPSLRYSKHEKKFRVLTNSMSTSPTRVSMTSKCAQPCARFSSLVLGVTALTSANAMLMVLNSSPMAMAITVYVFRIFELASLASPGTFFAQVDPTELAGRAPTTFRQVPLDLE